MNQTMSTVLFSEEMIPFYYILFGVLGLLIGSFLNVCIYRIQ